MTTLSVQLYSLRDHLTDTLEPTLDRIAEAGANEVEPFGVEKWAVTLAAPLQARNLPATSSHGGLLADLEGAVAGAKQLGTKHLFVPSSDRDRWTEAAYVADLAGQLNQLAAKLAPEGITVGYHNHEFEFAAKIDGEVAYDVFAAQLDDAVKLELDTYWARVGGSDPVDVLAQYGDKITHLHVKDGPLVRGEANVVLGQGQMDLDSLLSASQDKIWVVEFDSCDGDVVQATVDSLRYLQER